MTVKQSKNGTWFTQFRCKDKFGEEVHKCKRGFGTAEEAQAWEDDFIASAGCTMAMTFAEFYEVYERTFGRACASTRGATRTTWSGRRSCPSSRTTA